MNAVTVSSAIEQFATSVRRALDDLPADEVEELTDGLEADLADRMDDPDAAELGDPVAYADELRGAAGLPSRIAPVRRPLFEAVGIAMRHAIDSRPWLAALVQFFVALRALWWVYRGLAIAAIVAAFVMAAHRGVPAPFAVVLAAVTIVLSVQFGRGRWLRRSSARVLLVLASVASVTLGAVALGFEANLAIRASAPVEDYSSYSDGLVLNGSQVANIFAYDSSGNPLSDVQLFDQDGQPLDLASDPTAPFVDRTTGSGQDLYVLPNKNVPGRLAWNVYPLSIADSDDGDPATAPARVPTPPVATVSPLASVPTPSPSAP